MNLRGLHDLSALRALRLAQGPEHVEGLRLRPLARRVSLEWVQSNPVETRNKDFLVVAGAYSRIRKIRE